MSDAPPDPVVLPATGETTAIALVLPGGRADSFEPWAPDQLAAVRMRPFANHLHRAGAAHGLGVWQVGYRVRGWNGELSSPVVDTRVVLEEIRRRHGDVPVVLVGHSMGGRVALRVADDPSVRAVVALAPWVEGSDPIAPIKGRALLVAHGNLDVVTSAKASRVMAAAAARITSPVARFKVRGDMHAMIFRWRTWHRLATTFTLASLGFAPMPRRIVRAIEAGQHGNFAVGC